eukprot:766189-Hanusia_phi.AAC.2
MQQRFRASMKDETITPREMTIFAKMLDHCLNAMEEFMQNASAQHVLMTDSFDQSQAISIRRTWHHRTDGRTSRSLTFTTISSRCSIDHPMSDVVWNLFIVYDEVLQHHARFND